MGQPKGGGVAKTYAPGKGMPNKPAGNKDGKKYK
jgi:hypothetical protein